jgi:hypothetical protein
VTEIDFDCHKTHFYAGAGPNRVTSASRTCAGTKSLISPPSRAISFTIRERVRIKGEIRVMTAQVRTSATILSMIPLFLTIALWFISPEYISEFFSRGPFCGWLAVGTIVGMIVSGYFVMMKIADIEV